MNCHHVGTRSNETSHAAPTFGAFGSRFGPFSCARLVQSGEGTSRHSLEASGVNALFADAKDLVQRVPSFQCFRWMRDRRCHAVKLLGWNRLSAPRIRGEPVVAPSDRDKKRWNHKQRYWCRQREAADYSQGEWLLKLTTGSEPERERKQTEKRAKSRHQYRPQSNSRCFNNRFLEWETTHLHSVSGEIEQDNSVLHDQADEKNEAHERRNVQRRTSDEQEPDRTNE